MAKVRFELNIDEIIEGEIYLSNDNEVFKNPEATGKTFLFVDKLGGMMQAAFCKEAASGNNKYARVEFYPISQNAVIIDEDVKDDKHEALMAHIQDCCDKVCTTLQTFHQQDCEHYACAMEVVNSIRGDIEEGGTGNGISEKTLLEALKIVSKRTE